MKKACFIALTLIFSVYIPVQAQSTSALPWISGLVNVRYQYNGATDAHGFDVRRARLDFRGDLAPRATYRLQVDLAGTPKILDAYLQWRPTGRLAVRFCPPP